MNEITPISNDRTASRRAATGADLMLLPSVLGVLVSCAATLAVSHDLGFFWVIGIDFINVLTTADLIKSTANWLLPLAIPTLIWGMWEVKSPSYTPYVNNYISQGLLSRSSWRSYWDVFKSNKLFTIISLFTPINLVFFSAWYAGVGSLIIIAISAYLSRKFIKSLDPGRSSIADSPYFLSILVLVGLSLAGFFIGFVEGESDLAKNSPVFMIKADKLDDTLGVMIRNSEKGILIKQGDLFVFVPWDNVKTLSKLAPVQNKRSLASRLYHWWVDPPPPTP